MMYLLLGKAHRRVGSLSIVFRPYPSMRWEDSYYPYAEVERVQMCCPPSVPMFFLECTDSHGYSIIGHIIVVLNDRMARVFYFARLSTGTTYAIYSGGMVLTESGKIFLTCLMGRSFFGLIRMLPL